MSEAAALDRGDAAPQPELPPALELRDVSAAYGRFRALFGVSLSVAAGSVTALVGPNGAGKSTVARVATGLVPLTGGQIFLAGEDVTGLPTWRLVRKGVAHAPEGRSVFATLDVEDNLRLTFMRALGRKGAGDALERAYERFPRLADRRRQLAGTLSGGEQRMLALARVLAVPPKLLVVDELSLGLAPRIVDDVYRRAGRYPRRRHVAASDRAAAPEGARTGRAGRGPAQGPGRAGRARQRARWPGRGASSGCGRGSQPEQPGGTVPAFSSSSRVHIVTLATSH